MSRKVRRVPYTLDPKGITSLSAQEIAAILRGADELIARGGRSLLVRILKGSRMRKVLELGLDQCPVYGYYAHLSPEEILTRIDWTILHGYLDIQYDYRLPMLIYTEQGWEIERETFANELLQQFDAHLATGPGPYDMTYLKGRARDMMLLLLEEVEQTGDPKYIPLLKAWAEIDYKKVRHRIHQVIGHLAGKRSTGANSGEGKTSDAGV